MPIVNHLKDMAGVDEHGNKGLWKDMDNSGTIFSHSLKNQESILDDPEITPEEGVPGSGTSERCSPPFHVMDMDGCNSEVSQGRPGTFTTNFHEAHGFQIILVCLTHSLKQGGSCIIFHCYNGTIEELPMLTKAKSKLLMDRISNYETS
ncbi:hypothetical protein ARMGADRAFT_1040138 [Armillaria gallica]|uniref:Uncharacterized protein n=1 Tax=Armillaria gallica TaxID=47427 RepID=A0A2H3CYE4_ARMGA|nr:hypothetical protein ARMGADRAFT_1040138 [Armillaria gallica]